MSNSTRDYNTSVRANLPTGGYYDTNRDRYVANQKPFVTYNRFIQYLTYLIKFNFTPVAVWFLLGSLWNDSGIWDDTQSF